MTRYGLAIRDARRSCHVSANELAERIGLRSAASVYGWESGRRNPTYETVAKIEKALDLPPRAINGDRSARDGCIGSADLRAVLGLTYRQVDYWSRTLLDKTPGSGRDRRFTRDEAIRVAVGGSLMFAGAAVDGLRDEIRKASLDSAFTINRGFTTLTVDTRAIVARIDEAMDAP